MKQFGIEPRSFEMYMKAVHSSYQFVKRVARLYPPFHLHAKPPALLLLPRLPIRLVLVLPFSHLFDSVLYTCKSIPIVTNEHSIGWTTRVTYS